MLEVKDCVNKNVLCMYYQEYSNKESLCDGYVKKYKEIKIIKVLNNKVKYVEDCKEKWSGINNEFTDKFDIFTITDILE
jgi:hypothetical protein